MATWVPAPTHHLLHLITPALLITYFFLPSYYTQIVCYIKGIWGKHEKMHFHYMTSMISPRTMTPTQFLAHLAESSSELFWSPFVRRLSVCPSVCKLFLFSTSSQEPLGQFQPNLAQSILGLRGFKFVQMKGPALFQGEIIKKEWK